jgi:hypothetical protein
VRPPPSRERPVSASELEASAARALKSHGLALVDLEAIPGGADLVRRWRLAVASKDLRKLEPAHDRLMEALEQTKIESPMIQRRLKHVSELLASADRGSDKSALEALENRYLELLSQLQPELPQRDAQALLLKAAQLEADVLRISPRR